MKYTKKDKDTYLIALKQNGGNVSDACKSTNIKRRAVYNWIEKEEWFKEAVFEIREVGIDNVETALYKNCMEGNVTAQIFFLKCKAKDRGYIDRVVLDGQIDHNIKQLVVNVMDTETKLLMEEMRVKLIDKDGKDVIEDD